MVIEIGDPFAGWGDVPAPAKKFGEVSPLTGRYHMPLLPGEAGVKKGGDWVPGGVQRVTNLVGAFEDTRALNVWEQAMGLIGLALDDALYEELCNLVHRAQHEGVNFELLREYPQLREKLAGTPQDSGESIIGRAKQRAKADAAARRGTSRHTSWEHRGATGELIGTPAMRQHVLDTEALLAAHGLERVPGLSERIVRNVEVGTVGKFDDILLEQRTGRLLMGDLKSKATAFFSWTAVDAQLATYANSDWMLCRDGRDYEGGPTALGVDLTEGVILHVPSDGGPARLERADLVQGWKNAQLARQVIDARAAGKSADRHRRAVWAN